MRLRLWPGRWDMLYCRSPWGDDRGISGAFLIIDVQETRETLIRPPIAYGTVILTRGYSHGCKSETKPPGAHGVWPRLGEHGSTRTPYIRKKLFVCCSAVRSRSVCTTSRNTLNSGATGTDGQTYTWRKGVHSNCIVSETGTLLRYFPVTLSTCSNQPPRGV